MSTFRPAARALVAAALAVAVVAPGRASAESELGSPWIDLSNARARLVAGAPATRSAKAYLAGIELTLADGWKTYWRMPGDAGVPPAFDWSGSTNVASVKVLYPAPHRMHEAGAETVGYKTSVVFPVEVVPKDPAQPIDLALVMELGICRDICIPAEAKMSVKLVPATMAGKPSAALLAALDRVPRPDAGRRSLDPRVLTTSAKLDGPAPRLTVEAIFPRDSSTADAFLEAPGGLYVPMLKRAPDIGGTQASLTADANEAVVRFEADLSRTGNAQDLKGKTLTLTLVSSAGATETTWTLP